jgi:flagellar protein FlaG
MATDISNQIKLATPINLQPVASTPKSVGGEVAAPVAASQVAKERQNAAVSGQLGTPVAIARQPGAVQQAAVTEAVTYINDRFQKLQRNLEFMVEEETGMVLVKVYDKETEELVRQIPAEQVVKMARFMQEQSEEAEASSAEGFLIQEKA